VLERLPEIEVPALVIVGAEDRATPPAVAKQIHAGLADSRYVEIPAAGHLSALEQPVRVTRAILDFLEWRCRSTLVAR
jgi:pimeloyl-ACP methyl ester carboxylesterase